MSNAVAEIPASPVVVPTLAQSQAEVRKGLTKKEIAADHPTWCPGCGDFSVLAPNPAYLTRGMTTVSFPQISSSNP